MKYKWLFFVLLAVVFLSSCGGTSSLPSPSVENCNELETERSASLTASPLISDKRVSVYRNGLNRYFALSESGIYCVAHEKNGTYALYCDKQSDQFVKLCNRVDCPHMDETCDAFLDDESTPTLGYYKEKLYYIKKDNCEL